MPLQIGPTPENLPITFAVVVSRLGDWMFQHPAFVSPVAANFEYLDTLAVNPKPKINLGTNMWWGASPFDELDDELLASLRFEFTESQCGYPLSFGIGAKLIAA